MTTSEAGPANDRPPLSGRGLTARILIGAILYIWMALRVFLPLDRLGEAAYFAVFEATSVAIYGLGLWAFVDHLLQRRWFAAFLVAPALTFIHFIATGIVAMFFSFLATGQMPI